jgi:dTDP-4-amino-4,6-dideoxygalactose transaminase
MIPLFKVHMPLSVDGPLLDTLHSGFIGQGKKVEEFEDRLAEYFGNPNIVTTSSGTMALMIGLRICGVGPGDAVVSSPMTCSATSMAIKAVGADIVWSDIDPLTGNIDPESARKHITPKTKAIMCIHWGGAACELSDLLATCKDRGIKLVEDAAHALGGEYDGKKIGNHGDAVGFSLQAIKHINTIEGGFVSCRNSTAYAQAKLLRWFGINREGPRIDMRCEQDIEFAGYKGNLVDPFAVIGIEQMKWLPKIVEKQQANAAYYMQELSDLKKTKMLRYSDKGKSAAWLFSILVDDKNKFRKFMVDNGIMVSAVHSRNDVFSCFADSLREPLPGVDYFSQHQMSIPVHWALTDEHKSHIIKKIREYERKE